GTVFSTTVYQISEGQRTAKGSSIVSIINVPEGENVRDIITMLKDLENNFIILASKSAIVKKSELSEYRNMRQNGLKAIKVVEGDEILAVRISNGKKDVLLAASSGKSIRFSEDDCRAQGRVSQGVKGITLDEGEEVIGMELIDET